MYTNPSYISDYLKRSYQMNTGKEEQYGNNQSLGGNSACFSARMRAHVLWDQHETEREMCRYSEGNRPVRMKKKK